MTTNKDWPKAGESWNEFFKRTGKFSDFMIHAWGYVEDTVDQMVVQEFGLNHTPEGQDVKADFLRNAEFRKKLTFLKDSDRINSEDFKQIQQFSTERNKLFHGNIYKPIVWTLSENEKERIMSLGLTVSSIVTKRGFTKLTKEGGKSN